MRDIKFRAWDKEEKRFWYFGLQEVLERQMSYKGSWDLKILKGEKTQHTGLKDKNGVEIYEGDIIEGEYLNPLTNKFISEKYLIEYKDGGFLGRLIGSSPYGDTLLKFINGEVIGNIYETPELLEEI